MKITSFQSFMFLLTVGAAVAQTQPKAEPERLTTLRKSWQQAREKALNPIDEKYRQELERMMDLLTKAGDLDGALAVKSEIESINPAVSGAGAAAKPSQGISEKPARSLNGFSTVEAFRDWLVGTEWSSDDDVVYTFPEAGVIERTEKKSGESRRWNVETTKIGEISWPYSGGGTGRMTIDSNLREGKESNGTPIRRIKP